MYMRLNRVGQTSSMEEGSIAFPRKDDGSPRKQIYRNECPAELKEFEACMDENDQNLAACRGQMDALEQCGNAVFKVINAMETPYDFAKGLSK